MRSAGRLLVASLSLFLTAAAAAEEIGYLEEFSLARDRSQPLEQLIPGTEDYYYYRCLHLQNLEQYGEVEKLLPEWIKRHNYTPRVREILNRQALLTYPQHPQQSLEYIRQQLNLHFNHQRETVGEKPNLPTALNLALIARDRLRAAAMARHQNLHGFEDSALDWLVAAELNPDQRRDLLQRLQRPDHPGLAKLVVDDLNHPNSGGFGSLPIHGQLLLKQLDECLERKPELRNQSPFIYAYLVKLQPSADVDLHTELDQRREYLERLWAFVQTLAPAHNSLKAHVLYHRLLFDSQQGVYDTERLLTYLQLPRPLPYVEPRFLQLDAHRAYPVDMNADFSGWTLLPPVGNDEPLVRSYLQHFFREADSFEPFAPYIHDGYLKRQFAETKILHGQGQADAWYSWLTPAEFQALKDRVDLDFVPTNPTRFAADDPVRLELDVKNVGTLIVKVYEINTSNFYRENLREVNTDIDLDGLVANWEETHQYPEPPLRRVRRTFDFPQLDQPGVYVIDFIGSGRSSRAVVRKGQLRHVVRTTAAGQVFLIVDEQNRRLTDASLWLGGRQFTADAQGRIVVPFSTTPQRQPIVLSQGGFSSLAEFDHEAENYALAAGIYVDREALLERNTARVVIRPQLTVNGIPVTLEVLEEVRLNVTSRDRDDVQTTVQVADFAVQEDRESVYEFQVPQRLRSLRFQLQAKVHSLSQNKKVDLAVDETFTLNEIDTTDKVEDLHLVLIDGQYALDLLGRTGERRGERPVQLSLKHWDFREPVTVSLKTDPAGRIRLGPLPDISALTAQGPEGTSHTWNLLQPSNTYYDQRHGREGEALVIPFPAIPAHRDNAEGKAAEPDQEEAAEPDQEEANGRQAPSRDEVSLLELRGETFAADRFPALTVDGGLLRIEGLPRGDYDLWLKRPDRRIRLRIAEGRREAGYVLGRHRQLEIRGAEPLQIASVQADEQHVAIRLQNVTPGARVHVFATHFWPAYSAFAHLAGPRDAEPAWSVPRQLSALYVEGRDIGDEYRYIIDRKYAAKYPGNMLERPGLLLNPWPVRTTETARQDARAGAVFAPEAEAAPGGGGRGQAAKEQAAGAADFSNLDFLAHAATVQLNLRPDEDGVVSLARDQLGPHQHLHVVAVDPRSTVYRALSLPEPEVPLRDLRLARGLDPDEHYTQKKQITAVAAEERFELADITSSRFEIYDSLAKVYGLYRTLSGDARLGEFAFVTQWPDLKAQQQREKYSEFASHELNFFLYHKDPEFFRSVVRPLLQNKKEKQFMDLWLLEEDLTEFLQPWSFQRLNIAERSLLAQRIADRPQLVRHVRELFELLPPDIDRFNQLFETAVQGSALETGDALGLRAARQLEEKAVELQLGAVVDRAAAAPAPPASGPVPSQPAAPREAAEQLRDGADKAENGRRESLGRQRRGAESREQLDLYFNEQEARKSIRQLYQTLDQTREWAENHYYRLPIEQQTAELITVNAFWRDFAEHDPGGQTPFRSTHLAEASRSFPEMMFALAVLDLPFTAGKHQADYADGQLTLTAGSPLIAFHEEIKPAEPAEDPTPILVSQNFFRLSDRYRWENNERRDKFLTEEFLVHVVYGCQVVITNPTSSAQKLDVLLQVPLGAIPVLNGRYTRSLHLDLQPYSTHAVEYHFYFPAPGDFPHYPVQVARNERFLAGAEPFTFHVVAEATLIDTGSWDYISQFGSDDQVIDYLQQNNVQRTNLDKIAFRVRDKAFFDRVIALLQDRQAYNHTLWSYGIQHNVPPVIDQFLRHCDAFVAQSGDYLLSPLLTIDPVQRKAYQHLEYRPLVNARRHQLGARRQILNDRLHQQYHRLLKILSYRSELGHDELMSVTYYLLLQDRVEEALEFFGRVQPERLATRLQYDYFAAYLAFYREQPDEAREIAARYAEYPVDRWREAFAAVTAQLNELAGQETTVVDPEDRDQQQARLAATEPNFDFRVEARQVTIQYQNLKQVVANYYLMDVELLFSRNPFVQQHAGQFSHIRPNLSQAIELPAEGNQHSFALPESLHNRNVLVEIRGDGLVRSAAYYANSLAVQLIESYGQVRVTDKATGGPLPKAYVKVYARMKDGQVRFYKDGYTDLRGRFDYGSLSTNELDFVDRFALLILSEQHGATVREAAPPQR